MKAMEPDNSRWIHEGLILGNTPKLGTDVRNEIERAFRRLKGFRRIFNRFDNLGTIFMAFLASRSSLKHCDSINRLQSTSRWQRPII